MFRVSTFNKVQSSHFGNCNIAKFQELNFGCKVLMGSGSYSQVPPRFPPLFHLLQPPFIYFCLFFPHFFHPFPSFFHSINRAFHPHIGHTTFSLNTHNPSLAHIANKLQILLKFCKNSPKIFLRKIQKKYSINTLIVPKKITQNIPQKSQKKIFKNSSPKKYSKKYYYFSSIKGEICIYFAYSIVIFLKFFPSKILHT